MFVRYYLELPIPPARVEQALLGSPAWLSELAGEAQRPPLGVVGQAIDRVLLHRVAEATVKDFLDRVGRAIALSGPPGPASMGP
jgi:hypothetical protein